MCGNAFTHSMLWYNNSFIWASTFPICTFIGCLAVGPPSSPPFTTLLVLAAFLDNTHRKWVNKLCCVNSTWTWLVTSHIYVYIGVALFTCDSHSPHPPNQRTYPSASIPLPHHSLVHHLAQQEAGSQSTKVVQVKCLCLAMALVVRTHTGTHTPTRGYSSTHFWVEIALLWRIFLSSAQRSLDLNTCVGLWCYFLYLYISTYICVYLNTSLCSLELEPLSYPNHMPASLYLNFKIAFNLIVAFSSCCRRRLSWFVFMNFNDFYFVLITISYGSGGVFPLCLLVYFSQRWQSGKSHTPTPSFFFFVCLFKWHMHVLSAFLGSVNWKSFKWIYAQCSSLGFYKFCRLIYLYCRYANTFIWRIIFHSIHSIIILAASVDVTCLRMCAFTLYPIYSFSMSAAVVAVPAPLSPAIPLPLFHPQSPIALAHCSARSTILLCPIPHFFISYFGFFPLIPFIFWYVACICNQHTRMTTLKITHKASVTIYLGQCQGHCCSCSCFTSISFASSMLFLLPLLYSGLFTFYVYSHQLRSSSAAIDPYH